MRKHFLLLFLMALLPLSGWAVSFLDETVTASADDAAFNTALNDIKAGITVRINSTPTDAWDWDGKYYSTQLAAANESTSGLVAPVTESTTPEPGTYYIRIVPTTAVNSDYKVIALIIRKASLAATDYAAATAVTPLTYDGTEHTLISAATYGTTGSAEKCGEITYTIGTKPDGYATPVDEGCTYSTALPKATNGGKYYVFWKLAGSTRYAGVKGWVEVTIDGKDLDDLDAPTTGNNFKMNAETSYTYTGKGQAPTFTVKDGDIDISSSVEVKWYKTTGAGVGDIAATPETGAPSQAGNYQAVLSGKDNYSGEKTDVTWRYTIAKKVINIKIKNLTSVYNGEAVDLDEAEISYPGLCAADALASLNNFGNQLTVKFADDFGAATGPTNVKWTTDATPVVGSYGLVIELGADFEETSLYKNYQIMVATVASDIDDTSIASVTGKYTITRKPVTYRPRLVEMEYGSLKPAAPAAGATLDVADNPETPGDETVVGTLEIISEGKMVGNESFLAALDFDPDAKATSSVAWKDAPAGQTYTGTMGLKWKASSAATEAALAVAKNYEVTFQKGDVKVVGKPVTVYVNNSSVEYGADLSTWNPGYDANGLNLGTVSYKVYNVDTNEEVTDLENLPIDTYLVLLDGYTAPANYNVTNVEPGFLVVKRKKINITINPLVLSPGTTKAQLNGEHGYASVDESYKDELVGDDTELTYTFSFNFGAGEGQIPNDQKAAIETDLNAAAVDGTYAKGITADIIAWDVTKSDDVNTAAGAVKANLNYEVTFVEGSLKVVAGNQLYLAQTDAYLLEKINAAATVCAAAPDTEYAINFDDRAVPSDGDEWFAYVLPFDIKVKDLSKAFDYAVVNVLDVAKTGATANVNGNKYVYFKLEMNEIKANQPFLMKVYSEGEGATPEEIALSKKDKMNKVNFTVKNIKTATAAVSVNSVVEGVTEFTGLYGTPKLIEIGSTDRFLATSPAGVNQWWTATNNPYTVKSLEAYLKMAEGAGARIFIEDFNNGTTAIKELGVDGTAKAYNVDGWYTLNGVKLQGAPTEKGIYINNGKKVVIK